MTRRKCQFAAGWNLSVSPPPPPPSPPPPPPSPPPPTLSLSSFRAPPAPGPCDTSMCTKPQAWISALLSVLKPLILSQVLCSSSFFRPQHRCLNCPFYFWGLFSLSWVSLNSYIVVSQHLTSLLFAHEFQHLSLQASCEFLTNI